MQQTDPRTSASSSALLAVHPCYDAKAQSRYARVHLPVAPRCNIQCNFCNRLYDCANENRPGVTSRTLTPDEALSRLDAVLKEIPNTTVVGIAGPGDPLANPESTFRTFELIRAAHPQLHLCLSTNGLVLPEHIDEIRGLHVEFVTVTVNALTPAMAARIYGWVRYRGQVLRDTQAGEVILGQQEVGIRRLAEANVLVKVNTVMIPGINQEHVPAIAARAKTMGACLFNVMPLIPVQGTAFGHLPAPDADERAALMDRCAAELPVMRHCRQCRADAVGLLSEDRSVQFA